jgi:hypothetical protein
MGMAAAVASADEPDFLEGDYVQLSGSASFVLRHSVRRLGDAKQHCIPAKSYWALTVQGGGIRYELNRFFAEGSNIAPESVEMDGVVIRPGSYISMQARVQVASRGYVLVSDPHNISAQMDPVDPSPSKPPFYGWACQSTAGQRQIYVDVVQVSREREYSMQVLTQGGSPRSELRTLASFGKVNLKMDSRSVQFAANHPRISVNLAIDQTANRLVDFESLLTLTGEVDTLDRSVPIRSQVPLICNPTR